MFADLDFGLLLITFGLLWAAVAFLTARLSPAPPVFHSKLAPPILWAGAVSTVLTGIRVQTGLMWLEWPAVGAWAALFGFGALATYAGRIAPEWVARVHHHPVVVATAARRGAAPPSFQESVDEVRAAWQGLPVSSALVAGAFAIFIAVRILDAGVTLIPGAIFLPILIATSLRSGA